MKKNNVLKRIGTAFITLTTAGLMWGCITDVDGITCDVNDDCEQGVCQYGVCVGSDQQTDTATIPAPNDTGTETGNQPMPLTGVDLLFVVDNSISMTEEQEMLATAIPSLTGMLAGGINGAPVDLRVAMVTTDMGFAYPGGVSPNPLADVYHGCEGKGNNGEFLANTSLCPAALDFWVAPGYLTPVNQVTGQVDFNGFTAASACVLENIGNDGCNYEQQLVAATAALNNYHQSVFLRPDALTVILVITDEEDCSKATADWIDLPELRDRFANVACGMHPEMLLGLSSLKNDIMAIKTTSTGVNAEGSVMFAAITGVPVGSVCEGRGDQIGNCQDVVPGVNGNGTMGDPEIVARAVQPDVFQDYYEYACRRYAEGESAENGDRAITAAYPATRIVEMAQLFGNMGYVYSICNADWSPVMTQVGQAVLQRMTPNSN